MDEIDPYLEARTRQHLFRESVIAFLGAEGSKEENEYCTTCRKAGLDADCTTCDKSTIGTLDGK